MLVPYLPALLRISTFRKTLLSTTMAPSKPRCTFKECKGAAQRIVGDCAFCDGHYCAKHRLLEDHKCTGLEDVSTALAAVEDPFSSATSSSPRWWLVGLAECIPREELGQLGLRESGANNVANQRSARRSLTSATPTS